MAIDRQLTTNKYIEFKDRDSVPDILNHRRDQLDNLYLTLIDDLPQLLGINIPSFLNQENWQVSTQKIDLADKKEAMLPRVIHQAKSNLNSSYDITFKITDEADKLLVTDSDKLEDNIKVKESFEITIEDPNPDTSNPIPKIQIVQTSNLDLGIIRFGNEQSKATPANENLLNLSAQSIVGDAMSYLADNDTYTYVNITVNSPEFQGTVGILRNSARPGQELINVHTLDEQKMPHTYVSTKKDSTFVALLTSNEKDVLATLAERYKNDPIKFARIILERRLQNRPIDLLVLDRHALQQGVVETGTISSEKLDFKFIGQQAKLFKSLGFLYDLPKNLDTDQTVSDAKGMALTVYEAIGPKHLNLPKDAKDDILETGLQLNEFSLSEAAEKVIEAMSEKKYHNALMDASFDITQRFGIIPLWMTPNDMDTYYQTGVDPQTMADANREYYLAALEKDPDRVLRDPKKEAMRAKSWKKNNINYLKSWITKTSVRLFLSGKKSTYDNFRLLANRASDMFKIGRWDTIASAKAIEIHKSKVTEAYQYVNALPSDTVENELKKSALLYSLFGQVRSLNPDLWHYGAITPYLVGSGIGGSESSVNIDYTSGELRTIEVNGCKLTIGVNATQNQVTKVKNQTLSLTLQGREGSLAAEPLTYYVVYTNGIPEARGISSGDRYQRYAINDPETSSGLVYSERDPRAILNNTNFKDIETQVYQLFRSELGTDV